MKYKKRSPEDICKCGHRRAIHGVGVHSQHTKEQGCLSCYGCFKFRKDKNGN